MIKKVFWVGGSAACEVPQADAAWVKEYWPKIACPACSTLLPQEHPEPIRVVLADDANINRIGPTGLTAWPFATGGIERALAMHIELPESDFALGDVVHRDAVISSHWSCAASTRMRIPQYGDLAARYSECAVCHRRFGASSGTLWIREEDISDLHIFSSWGGSNLYVTEEVWNEKGLARWPNVQTQVIEVRSGLPQPEIVFETEDTSFVQRRVAAWYGGMR